MENLELSEQLAHSKHARKLNDFLTKLSNIKLTKRADFRINLVISELNNQDLSQNYLQSFLKDAKGKIETILCEEMNIKPQNHFAAQWAIYGAIFSFPFAICIWLYKETLWYLPLTIFSGQILGNVIGKIKDRCSSKFSF